MPKMAWGNPENEEFKGWGKGINNKLARHFIHGTFFVGVVPYMIDGRKWIPMILH